MKLDPFIDGSRVMFPWIDRPSRKERVTAQYNSAQAAADYALANEGPAGRFFRLRLGLVQDILASCPGGDLLDAGCGPGVMVRTLLKARPDDFRITVVDQSAAMVKYCADNAGDVGKVRPTVGQLEAMPFADASFDVTLVMGALEYADARAAIGEISRITRPTGLVIVTMLNPLSPYRLTEWFLYWPVVRALGAIERALGVRAGRRHGAYLSGIHALPAGRLLRRLRQAGLQPVDVVYFDVTLLIPPFDRFPKLVRIMDHIAGGNTATHGWRRWMGTAYLIAAKRLLSGGWSAGSFRVGRRLIGPDRTGPGCWLVSQEGAVTAQMTRAAITSATWRAIAVQSRTGTDPGRSSPRRTRSCRIASDVRTTTRYHRWLVAGLLFAGGLALPAWLVSQDLGWAMGSMVTGDHGMAVLVRGAAGLGAPASARPGGGN